MKLSKLILKIIIIVFLNSLTILLYYVFYLSEKEVKKILKNNYELSYINLLSEFLLILIVLNSLLIYLFYKKN